MSYPSLPVTAGKISILVVTDCHGPAGVYTPATVLDDAYIEVGFAEIYRAQRMLGGSLTGMLAWTIAHEVGHHTASLLGLDPYADKPFGEIVAWELAGAIYHRLEQKPLFPGFPPVPADNREQGRSLRWLALSDSRVGYRLVSGPRPVDYHVIPEPYRARFVAWFRDRREQFRALMT